jgi:Metal-sensitive transcriptional repressor
MVDEDVYRTDVLTQVSAAARALQAVALGLLEDHLVRVADAVRKGGDDTTSRLFIRNGRLPARFARFGRAFRMKSRISVHG